MVFPFAVGTDSTEDVLYILGVYQEVKALLVLQNGLINFCCTLRSQHSNISSVMLPNFLENNMSFVTSDKQYHYQKFFFFNLHQPVMSDMMPRLVRLPIKL